MEIVQLVVVISKIGKTTAVVAADEKDGIPLCIGGVDNVAPHHVREAVIDQIEAWLTRVGGETHSYLTELAIAKKIALPVKKTEGFCIRCGDPHVRPL